MGNEQNVVDPLRNLDKKKRENVLYRLLVTQGPCEITLNNVPINKDGRHFSEIILNCNPDISSKKQMSLTIL